MAIYYLFFAKKSNAIDVQYQNQSKIRDIEKQIENFNTFFALYKDVAKHIVGIDVCSKESNYKPEVFNEIMDRKKSKIESRLKRMYHIGEKFSDILSGLRSIDECICFFDLRAGDRLGHAVPVYENINEWYEQKGYQILIKKLEHLDNMAWLYCNLPQEIQKGSDGKKILKEYQRYFYEIYISLFDKNIIIELLNIRNIKIHIQDITVFHYFEAWKLRREKPETIKQILYENTYNIDRVIAYYIAYCYFYNKEVKNVGYEEINISITKRMLKPIQIMQDIIQAKIKCRGICIEVCPSSNILLGNVRKGYYHPIINLFQKLGSGNKKSNIRFSINTDDQGIFSTSLISEYSLLMNIFENKTDDNGNKLYSKEFLYQWINEIRENSIML